MFSGNEGKCTFSWKVLLCLLALLSFVAASAFGQSSNGQITSLVTDSSGAAVEGASVNATNTATGVTYTGKTNNAGVYVLPQLIPGPYKVALAERQPCK